MLLTAIYIYKHKDMEYKQNCQFSTDRHNLLVKIKQQFQAAVSIPTDNKFPYFCVGFIVYVNDSHHGSFFGFLIEPNIVLTAADNLLALTQPYKFNLKFHNFTMNKGYKIKSISNYSNYQISINSGDTMSKSENNYAIMQLQEAVNQQFILPLLSTSQNQHKDDQVFCFEHQLHQITPNECIQFARIPINGSLIQYSYISDAGKPLMAYRNGQFQIIGIKGNPSCYFSADTKSKINQWVNIKEYVIDLKYTKFNSEKIHQKIVTLNQTNGLKSIKLLGCMIGDEGARQISLLSWPILSVILLGNNQITSQGAKYISKTIWPNLKQLCLKNNRIKNEGVRHLFSAVYNNIRTVGLMNNQITDDGTYYIIEEYTFCWPKIVEIGLWRNQMSQQLKEYIYSINNTNNYGSNIYIGV